MEKVEIKGTIIRYFRLPIYMLVPLVAVAIGICFFDKRLIAPAVIIVAIYAIVAIVSYVTLRRRCVRSLVETAVEIETSQKAFLENMPIPYAVMDNSGIIMWHNSAFSSIEEVGELSHIKSIFSELKQLDLSEAANTPIEKQIEKNESYYTAVIQKISENSIESTGTGLFSISLFDETKARTLEIKLDANKLVVANIIVDNYDDVMGAVDDVKNSLLQAVVERKIRKYFGEADAIIRKYEKDKYFLVFPKRFLNKLMEDKFSILEDIKNTKVGNDLQITLSIGMGLNGGSYVRDAEYAKSATSLALGRGGSQVVVKDGGDVSIFGIKGKEVVKNTRVKARVKAQALKELMRNRDRVIVMGHKISDFDCLGACVGIAAAARAVGKPCNMVINTVTRSLRPLMETFVDDENYQEDFFLNGDTAIQLIDKKTLLVIVDTNRPDNTECPELLQKTKDIVVLDHHRQSKEKIENTILSYMEPYASSTCEMVAEILQYFSDSISITPKDADALYAGMLIDTNNFMTKTGVRTFEAAAYLRRMGAEVTRVRKLLREDINAYKARAEIVRHAMVYRDAFAISVCNTPELESPTVVGAQASNELLNIVGIKASFVLTEFRDKIYVSSRSIDEIDVQLIMERLGGGGHLNVAGAQVEDSTIEEVAEQIRNIIDSMIEEGMIK